MNDDQRAGFGAMCARLAALADLALALLLSLVAIDVALPRRGGGSARQGQPGSETPAGERTGGVER